MVKFLPLLSVCLIGAQGIKLSPRLLSKIESMAAFTAEMASTTGLRNLENGEDTALFSVDVDTAFIDTDDAHPDPEEQRWTEMGRPWTRGYSKFRRVLKKMLQAQEIDDQIISDAPNKLRTYGCWCGARGDRDFANGRGPAQDKIDQACKALGACKTCVAMAHPDCNTMDTGYKFSIDEFHDNKTSHKMLKITCKDTVDSCEYMNCKCDSRNIMKIIAEYLAGSFRPELSQKRRWSGRDNEFQWRNMCAIKKRASIIHTPYECCGKFPDWKPFDTQHGRNRCCGRKIYDAEAWQCTDTDELVERVNSLK